MGGEEPESTGADVDESEINGKNGAAIPDDNGNEKMGDLLDMEESKVSEDINQVVTHGG